MNGFSLHIEPPRSFGIIAHRESNMNTLVSLNLLNELRKRNKVRGFTKHFITFSQQCTNTLY